MASAGDLDGEGRDTWLYRSTVGADSDVGLSDGESFADSTCDCRSDDEIRATGHAAKERDVEQPCTSHNLRGNSKEPTHSGQNQRSSWQHLHKVAGFNSARRTMRMHSRPTLEWKMQKSTRLSRDSNHDRRKPSVTDDPDEEKPAATTLPATRAQKLPRIVGWSNADALCGQLPRAQAKSADDGEAYGTVSVAREGMTNGKAEWRFNGLIELDDKTWMKASRYFTDADEPLCLQKRDLPDQLGEVNRALKIQKIISEETCDSAGNRDELADRVQRKINSAGWAQSRQRKQSHRKWRLRFAPPSLPGFKSFRSMRFPKQRKRPCYQPQTPMTKSEAVGSYFEDVDNLADQIQRKIDREGFERRASTTPSSLLGMHLLTTPREDTGEGVDEKLPKLNPQVPHVRSGKFDNSCDLAEHIQRKINEADCSRLDSSNTDAKCDSDRQTAPMPFRKETRQTKLPMLSIQNLTAAARLNCDGHDKCAEKITRNIDDATRDKWTIVTPSASSSKRLRITPKGKTGSSLERKLQRWISPNRHYDLPRFLETLKVERPHPDFSDKPGEIDDPNDLKSPRQLKIVVEARDDSPPSNSSEPRSSRSPPTSLPPPEFYVNEMLAHGVVLASTAMIHAGVFTFSASLRHILSLESHPFGIILLVSWAVEGIARCIGGVVGDLVVDRVALLRRAAFVWSLAVILFLVDAVSIAIAAPEAITPVTSGLASAILTAAFVFGVGAHGVVTPNLVALGAQSALFNLRNSAGFISVWTPKSPPPRQSDSIALTRIYSEVSEDSGERSSNSMNQLDSLDENEQISQTTDCSTSSSAQRARSCVNRFYSASFIASTVGSSSVQLFFFLFAEELPAALSSSAVTSSFSSSVSSESSSFSLAAVRPPLQVLVFLTFTGMFLIATLSTFAFQSRLYRPPANTNLAVIEKEASCPRKKSEARSLRETHGTARVIAGFALAGCSMVLLTGAAAAVIILIAFPHSSLAVRVSPFLVVAATWLVGMAIASRLLKSVVTRRPSTLVSNNVDGDSEPQEQLEDLEHSRNWRIQPALALLALGGTLACAAFVRGQLYSTTVTQLCQTDLQLPSALVGSATVLLRPEAAGGAVGLFSVLLLIILLHGSCVRRACGLSSATKKDPRSISMRFTTSAPATRMALAAALSLTGLFLASIVELYRRHAPALPIDPSRMASRYCNKPIVDLNVLWSTPSLIVLGAADALFRVSLHEQVHIALLQCHDAGLCNKRAGRVLGALALAEALGNAAALSLVAALASWLLGPTTSDLTLAFLLLTTGLALTFVMLKGVGQRVACVAATAIQRTRFIDLECDGESVMTPPPPPVPSSLQLSDDTVKRLMMPAGG